MKKNQVRVDTVENYEFRVGVAEVIGKTSDAYVNIYTSDGALLVSLDTIPMNRLVKKWVKAQG